MLDSLKQTYNRALSRVKGTLGLPNGTLVTFLGVDGKDVYNTSGPFSVGPKEFIAGRVEPRDSQDAFTMFFQKTDTTTWTLDSQAPVFELEDPFQSWIDGQLIVGGVRTLRDSAGVIVNYFTVFYRGTDVYNLQELTHGPLGMKDIRLVQIPDSSKYAKKILVFARPQGQEAGRGKISVTILDTLDQLTPENISNAAILENLYADGEWAGVNDLSVLPDGSIGVLYHIARADHSRRYYNAAAFVYNPDTGEITDNHVIATRQAYPEGPVKMLPDCVYPDDLKDVLFPSRLVLNESSAILYGGLSDTKTGMLPCPNPFKDHYLKK